MLETRRGWKGRGSQGLRISRHVISSRSTFEARKFHRSLLRKMKSSVLLAPGLFRRIERTRTTSEMFVAIIICLRGHRYKRDATRTSSVFVSHLLLHPPSTDQTLFLLSWSRRFVSWFFYLDLLRAWHEPRSVLPAFRRTCTELSGRPCDRSRGWGKSWSRWGAREDKRERVRGLGTYVSRNVRAKSRGQTRAGPETSFKNWFGHVSSVRRLPVTSIVVACSLFGMSAFSCTLHEDKKRAIVVCVWISIKIIVLL